MSASLRPCLAAALAAGLLTQGCGLLRVRDPLPGAGSGALAAPVALPVLEAPQMEAEPNQEFGASLRPSSAQSPAGKGLRVDYASGRGAWGALLRLRGARTVDAAGARSLEVEAWAPKGAVFSLGLLESTEGGGDGEAWMGPELKGQGRWKVYGVPLRRLFKSPYSGSQDGQGRLDAAALQGLEVQVMPGQGQGTLMLGEVVLR